MLKWKKGKKYATAIIRNEEFNEQCDGCALEDRTTSLTKLILRPRNMTALPRRRKERIHQKEIKSHQSKRLSREEKREEHQYGLEGTGLVKGIEATTFCCF